MTSEGFCLAVAYKIIDWVLDDLVPRAVIGVFLLIPTGLAVWLLRSNSNLPKGKERRTTGRQPIQEISKRLPLDRWLGAIALLGGTLWFLVVSWQRYQLFSQANHLTDTQKRFLVMTHISMTYEPDALSVTAMLERIGSLRQGPSDITIPLMITSRESLISQGFLQDTPPFHIWRDPVVAQPSVAMGAFITTPHGKKLAEYLLEKYPILKPRQHPPANPQTVEPLRKN